MSENAHVLGHGARLVLPATRAEEGLVMVMGGGRGASLRVEGPVWGVWLPLRGRLQLSTGDGENAHYRGELRITRGDAYTQATGRGHALWLALIGAPAVWRGVLAPGSTRDPELLPASHDVDRALLRRAANLARAARYGNTGLALDGVLEEIAAMQCRIDEVVARCPGRTWAQRRHVFLRLQRVREHLASHCHLDLDNTTLARIASYSPWHFIRAFHAAYRETPHAFLVRQRLQRAQRLLHSSPLAIGEIALACGFENRCAFSRLFRQRYGVTASTLRRRAASSVSLSSSFAARRAISMA